MTMAVGDILAPCSRQADPFRLHMHISVSQKSGRLCALVWPPHHAVMTQADMVAWAMLGAEVSGEAVS